MLALFQKEIRSFFSSLTGYLVIGLFLLASSLFLFAFSGSYNILDSGFADLKPFFDLAPWIFIFLIPAISMRSFSEEIKMGTMEILLTRPIGNWNIVFGKYFGILMLIVLAILPCIIYVIAIDALGRPPGNFDSGATIGSFIGLFFLGGCYAAASLFASSLTSNQIIAFLIGAVLCFVAYFAFDGLAELIGSQGFILEYLGINYHYESISRGVMDTRDIVYFLSFISLFLALTKFRISSVQNLRS